MSLTLATLASCRWIFFLARGSRKAKAVASALSSLSMDDMAAGSLFVMDLKPDVYRRETQPMLSQVNIGSGVDVTIRELAEIIAKITGFQGQLVVDPSKPDGTPQKLLDVSRLKKLGWTAAIELEDGIRNTYQWYLNQSPEHLRSQ